VFDLAGPTTTSESPTRLPYADRPPASRRRAEAPPRTSAGAATVPAPRRPVPSTDAVHVEPGRPARSLVKTIVDRSVAVLALLVLLPALAFVAAAVRVQSRGPAFYRQQRVGLGGRTFRIWKFRTMAVDADDHLHHLLRHHGRHTSPLFKVPDDPRVTALGRYLRRYSVDELPQLLNVVLGHMSLVGPRPQRPDEVALYAPEQHRRLAVRPGLTGMWQVSGRNDLPWHRAVELDLQYVDEWTLRLDATIVARTFGAVLRGTGAS
jgi:lipopolysaccharide/colanic/teichoic acid biosynthesis glycosyltransferase